MSFSAAALEYFKTHAIDDLVAAELGVLERDGSLVYTYRADDDSTYQRTYALSPNGGPRARQPAGQSLTLWRPVDRSGAAALICEGESDALAAITVLREAPLAEMRELPVLAIPGTGFPADRLVAQLADLGIKEAFLAFDADDAGRAYTGRVAGPLRIAGVRPILVQLPDGFDLADAAAAATDRAEWLTGLLCDSRAASEEVTEEIRKPRSTTTTLNRLDVGHMVREMPPPVPWVITGFAVEGCLSLLTGREGVCKSLFAASLVGAVATGSTIAGMECQQGVGLYVDGENGAHEIHRRVHSLDLPATGVEIVEADGFHLGRHLDELIALIREVKPTFVVLDSFRSLWPGGDENDTAAAAAALDPLRNALRAEGAAGLLLHHLAKGAGDYRGSTAIGASVELGFKLTQAPGDPEKADRRQLDCYKCRPAPEPDRRWLRLHVERGQVYIDTAEPFDDPGEASAPATQPVRAELAPDLLAAAAEPIQWPDLARAIGREPKDGTARRLRDDLLECGELTRLPDGCLQGVKVPEGLAPTQTALQSGTGEGCQGAGGPIGGAASMAPSDPGGEA